MYSNNKIVIIQHVYKKASTEETQKTTYIIALYE